MIIIGVAAVRVVMITTFSPLPQAIHHNSAGCTRRTISPDAAHSRHYLEYPGARFLIRSAYQRREVMLGMLHV
jgi:hypothetical protein